MLAVPYWSRLHMSCGTCSIGSQHSPAALQGSVRQQGSGPQLYSSWGNTQNTGHALLCITGQSCTHKGVQLYKHGFMSSHRNCSDRLELKPDVPSWGSKCQ